MKGCMYHSCGLANLGPGTWESCGEKSTRRKHLSHTKVSCLRLPAPAPPSARMPQEDRYAGAKTFLAKLGFDGAAVDALLVGKVAADTDDGLPVPKPVKKAWQRWSLTGHPDKGGDEEAYNAMKGEYTAFKQNFQAWQQEHPSGHPHFQAWCAASMPASSRGPPSASKQKAELKGKAAAAFEAAQVALAQGRYEDAAAKGAEAKRLSEKAQGMSKVTDKDVRELIEQAIDLIERAEEGVQRDREEAQKRRSQEEAMEAFEALWRAVCAGTLDGGLGWAQKAAAVRECFEDKKVVNTCMARGAALWPLGGQTCS